MNFNYELNNPRYAKGVLIKHKGLPLYINGELITPHSFVWWWPVNWIMAIVGVAILIKHRMGKSL